MNTQSKTCFCFYEGWRLVKDFYKAYLGNDITPQQVYVFDSLEKDKKITMNELSKRMNLDSSAVSTLISRMEKKGFVVREHGTEDRRTVFVSLTSEGNEKKIDISEAKDRAQKAIEYNLDADQIKTLTEIVEIIRNDSKDL